MSLITDAALNSGRPKTPKVKQMCQMWAVDRQINSKVLNFDKSSVIRVVAGITTMENRYHFFLVRNLMQRLL